MGQKISDLLQAFELPQALATSCKRSSFRKRLQKASMQECRAECPFVGGMMSPRNLPVAGALQVLVHETSRVVRAGVTSNGKLSVDLIAKVDGKDGK